MLDWEVKAAEKRARADAAIPKDWRLPADITALVKEPWETTRNNLFELGIVRASGLLTAEEFDITENYTVSALLEALAKGTLSAVQVTVAFSKRAAIAQQVTGCLTEVFFDRALERARELDALKSEGKLAGPLHGLPVSIKDGFQIAGIEATIGLVSYLDRGASEVNSPLVDILLQLGAVLYVKTNVPQTLMTADSHNNVFGRVLNPWNTMLGAGGSSGGEGALVAFRGSPLGIGTDVAGSIRIPALCCGTYGFKPSTARIPYGGQVSCANVGLRTILPVAGPLANDFDALDILMKAVIRARPALLDFTAIDLPWRDVPNAGNSKLRLGLLSEDPLFPLHPPVQRALVAAVEALKRQGHEIVPLAADACHVADAAEVAWKMWALDNRADSIVKASGEPAVPSRVVIASEARNMDWNFVPDLEGLDGLGKLATLNIKRAEIVKAWNQIWTDHSLDAVISPPAAHTAIEHDTYGLPVYTNLLNVLEYPACVIPFGRVCNASPPETFEKKPGQAGPAYHPDAVDGAPCSIQVFTRGMRDEECLVIAKTVDLALHR
ncbi:amidase [Thozetella sp. PMI_491]|nr:amidase [Thozetella sp. PMI_491]